MRLTPIEDDQVAPFAPDDDPWGLWSEALWSIGLIGLMALLVALVAVPFWP
jgi:hypothetical protein